MQNNNNERRFSADYKVNKQKPKGKAKKFFTAYFVTVGVIATAYWLMRGVVELLVLLNTLKR